MKNVFLIIAILMLGLTACKKECETPPASENIVGKWSSALDSKQAEFKSDGTIIDPDEIIISIGDPEAEKTYSFVGADSISVTAASQGSNISTKYAFENIACDQIGLGFLGITLNFNRVE